MISQSVIFFTDVLMEINKDYNEKDVLWLKIFIPTTFRLLD